MAMTTRNWILGIANSKPTKAGSFLTALADAALRADAENFEILLPALEKIQAKYPEYCDAEE